MSKLDIELSEFCASAIETYGRAEVCDAVCSLMAALALESESSEYYAAIDEAVARRDESKAEALSQEVSDFFESIGRRYGEKTSALELIKSIAATVAKSHDDSHMRRIGELYFEKVGLYRRLLRKARH
jgi:hypothetical protein